MTPLQQLQEEETLKDILGIYNAEILNQFQEEYLMKRGPGCEEILYPVLEKAIKSVLTKHAGDSHIYQKEIVDIFETHENKVLKLGQLSGIELSEGCIPEEIKYIDPSGEKIYYQDNLAEQFNKCRTESLTNLSDLKKNIQHE